MSDLNIVAIVSPVELNPISELGSPHAFEFPVESSICKHNCGVLTHWTEIKLEPVLCTTIPNQLVLVAIITQVELSPILG